MIIECDNWDCRFNHGGEYCGREHDVKITVRKIGKHQEKYAVCQDFVESFGHQCHLCDYCDPSCLRDTKPWVFEESIPD